MNSIERRPALAMLLTSSRPSGFRSVNGIMDPLTQMALMTACARASWTASSSCISLNSRGPISSSSASKARSNLAAGTRTVAVLGVEILPNLAAIFSQISVTSSLSPLKQIVSFWGIQKGSKGTGGRSNATRYRHHNPEIQASNCDMPRPLNGLGHHFRILRLFMHRVLRVLRALDDHWLGDLLGVIFLFGGLWLGLVAAAVLQ